MTLAELINKANQIQWRFNSAWIPLKLDSKDVDIDFEPEGSNETGFIINMTIKTK